MGAGSAAGFLSVVVIPTTAATLIITTAIRITGITHTITVTVGIPIMEASMAAGSVAEVSMAVDFMVVADSTAAVMAAIDKPATGELARAGSLVDAPAKGNTCLESVCSDDACAWFRT